MSTIYGDGFVADFAFDADYGPYRGSYGDPRNAEPVEYIPDPRDTLACTAMSAVTRATPSSALKAEILAVELAETLERLKVENVLIRRLRPLLVEFAESCAYEMTGEMSGDIS